MKLRDFILRRVLLAIPVVFGVLTITWFLAYVVGDPVSIYINENTPATAIPAIRAAHGFDEPLHVQYFLYLSSLFQGDWGISASTSFRPVLEVISIKFPATIELSIIAMILAIVLGIPLGIFSATRKDQKADHITRIFSLAGVSMPIFWFALMLKYVFFYQFTVLGPPFSLIALPGGERYTFVTFGTFDYITGFLLIDSLLVGNLRLFIDALQHLIMPAFCLGYLTLAIITRMMRSSMLEVLKENRGLSTRIEECAHTHCDCHRSGFWRSNNRSSANRNNLQLAWTWKMGCQGDSIFGCCSNNRFHVTCGAYLCTLGYGLDRRRVMCRNK
ncbi:MAG: ABC transporter permease [Candidatus Thorarchaeota archaeon]|jgi:peptide/nickel transport system permease protein